MADVRQRKQPPTSEPTESSESSEQEKTKLSPSQLAKAEDSAFSLLDVARTIVFLILASTALSYFITRESFVWNLERPSWTRPAVIKSYFSGPQAYTDVSLRAYDGSSPDPTVPILLAINGTIYDVSAGRRHYGPGGSYHFFAGADASRAFVTSCFDSDITPDMRGVEEMFIPLDDEEVDALYTKEELEVVKKRERKVARRKVDEALRHWVDFFAKSNKYHKVGEVKREKGWETKGPAPTLCPRAQEGRPKSRARPAGR